MLLSAQTTRNTSTHMETDIKSIHLQQPHQLNVQSLEQMYISAIQNIDFTLFNIQLFHDVLYQYSFVWITLTVCLTFTIFQSLVADRAKITEAWSLIA